MLSVSHQLHGTLVILGALMLCGFFLFIIGHLFRNVLQEIKAISGDNDNDGESASVLLLDSPNLSAVRRVLFTINDSIPMHPRQIRRLLRRSLDSNIVEEIAICRPLFHLNDAVFRRHRYGQRVRAGDHGSGRRDEWEWRFECKSNFNANPNGNDNDNVNGNGDHHRFHDLYSASNSDSNSNSIDVRFVFYFGASKSYLSQIEAMTKKAAALRARASPKGHGKRGIRNQQNVAFKLPWKSLFDSEQRAPSTTTTMAELQRADLERVGSISISNDGGNIIEDGGDGDGDKYGATMDGVEVDVAVSRSSIGSGSGYE